MGCWGMGLTQSDEFCEFYDKFMELYDAGKNITEIPDELLAEYRSEFEPDDGVFHDAYFAIAKAQWMCGGVHPEIMQKVCEIISSGANLDFLRELDAGESDLKQRQRNLEKFLQQLQTPRPTVRKRRPPAKPRELPPMEPGDVFSFKAEKGSGVFICLGQQYLPNSSFWGSIPVCILRLKYEKTLSLDNLLDESVGLVCSFLPKAFPPTSKMNHLGRIKLPEGSLHWNQIPDPPAMEDDCYWHVGWLFCHIRFITSDCRKLFIHDYSGTEHSCTLRDLIYQERFK